ncbi:MAG: 2-amino-4-hydroxy-6-hydroxymethyldihydropteridine diphosphokinase, partial [Burkholderiales bacterium]
MSAPFVVAYVALGSNIDSPAEQVGKAFRELDEIQGIRVIARSSLYRTAPVGYVDQPDFINAVAKVETALGARKLLDALFAIERAHGRSREFRNAPRTLDLDLLLHGDHVIAEPGLTIPHPRLHERAFVLVPLKEIAPKVNIPGYGEVA